MKKPVRNQKKYAFRLDAGDFEKILLLADRDCEGNISFFVRKLLKEELRKNADYFDKLKKSNGKNK